MARRLRQWSLWPLALFATAGAAFARPPVDVALTFDDLPAHGTLPPGETRLTVVARILAALKAQQVREAYGFVAGSFGRDDPDAALVLRAWRSAGHPLGNHSWSHGNLDTVDVDVYTADITRNEAVIAPLMKGRDWRWFRYPYLAEGSDPATHGRVRAFLAARGYRVASVTLNFDDWAFNDVYARCVQTGDVSTIARLESEWLAAARSRLDQSRTTTVPGTPLVALLHAGAFTARMLPALLSAWQHEGARFVGLARAERHPLYWGDTCTVATGQQIRTGTGATPPDFTSLCR